MACSQLQRPDQRHSLGFLSLVDWMLAPQPADRPQSVAELRAALAGGNLPERHAPKGREKFAATLRRRQRWLWAGAFLVLAAAAAVGARYVMTAESLPWLKPPG